MRILLPFAFALALAIPVDADHCTTWSDAYAHLDTNPGGDTHPGPRYYVVNELLCQVCIMSLWIYEESNGIDGLQRGDELQDTTCHGMIPSDTIVL